MTLGLPPSIRAFLCVASAISTLTVIEPPTAYAQDTDSRQNACKVSDNLKATKMVNGDYAEEAARKNVEGTVALCVTVDGSGKVTDVDVVSGPSELFQPSIDAAKQWQFEPPPKAPAAIKIEMVYRLTKPCPDGGKGMDVGEVTVNIGTGHSIKSTQGDALEIVGNVYQPLPPYPEKARAESRRGKLYLSIVVDPDGGVVAARIVKSLDELLDKLALDTVRTWRFEVSSGGKTTVFPVTLNFQIPCLSRLAQEQLSIDSPKVVIDAVDLEGAIHLPETVKEQLVISVKQREYEEDSAWISDLENMVVRAETEGWPDRENEGYMGFSVSAQWKPIRRDPGLLHVSVTILVDEGQPKTVDKIEFRFVKSDLTPPVFSSDDLRRLVPLQDGEIYNQKKYYAGLSAVTRAYSQKGFIDCTATNNMESDQVNQTIAIVVDVNEGPQYRWGNLQVLGLDPKIETLLRSQLKTGDRVNPRLIEDFYRDNKFLLPVGASPENVRWQHDPERAVVNLTFDFHTRASP